MAPSALGQRRRSVPAQTPTPPTPLAGSPASALSLADAVLAAPSPATAPLSGLSPTQRSKRPLPGASHPKLVAQADALARMTIELNVRALAAQAERVERDLRDLVARTVHNDDFRKQHERRLAEITREILAIKTRNDELHGTPSPFDAHQRDLLDLRDRLMAEMSDLRASVTAVIERMDTLPTPEQADEMLRLAAQGNRRHHAVEPRTLTPAAQQWRSTECSAQPPQRRIREAIRSTRRWHRDRKDSSAPDAQFVANYLRQQSKRDPGMAVFIQRAIQRRVQLRRAPRGPRGGTTDGAGGREGDYGGKQRASPPRSLEEFCREVTWQDVKETVVAALVDNEESAVKALLR